MKEKRTKGGRATVIETQIQEPKMTIDVQTKTKSRTPTGLVFEKYQTFLSEPLSIQFPPVVQSQTKPVSQINMDLIKQHAPNVKALSPLIVKLMDLELIGKPLPDNEMKSIEIAIQPIRSELQDVPTSDAMSFIIHNDFFERAKNIEGYDPLIANPDVISPIVSDTATAGWLIRLIKKKT
jgi:hypothetical protein